MDDDEKKEEGHGDDGKGHGHGPVWRSAMLKLNGDILNYKSLWQSPHSWHWYKKFFAPNPIWIDGNRFLNLKKGIENELKNASSTLKEEMRSLIKGNESIFDDICKFDFVNQKYVDKSSQRQDNLQFGLKASVNEDLLGEISLFSSDPTFNAGRSYDMESYLGALVSRGHVINERFGEKLKEILQEDGVDVRIGPVKRAVRCRAKAEIDYGDAKWPKTARIIDLIRGSCTYTDLKSFKEALNRFMTCLDKQEEIESECPSSEKDSMGCHFEIMRVKNGFHKLIGKTGDDSIPSRYFDIKLNLIATVFDSHTNEYISLVGELQFLLEPMLRSKCKDHEVSLFFYLYLSLNPFIHSPI